MDADDTDLIEIIYTAGLVPELWPKVIEKLAQRVGAHGGSLFSLSEGQLAWEAPASTRPIMEAYVEGGWDRNNPRLESLLNAKPLGFMRDQDVIVGNYDELPIVRDFLRPHNIYGTAATVIPGVRGDIAVLSVDRGREPGPYTSVEIERLDGFRPHLARAIALTSRMRMREARTAAAALQMVGIPAAVVRRQHGVVATNALFDALVGPVFLATGHGHLALSDRAADALLQQTLRRQERMNPTVRSIPVTGQEGAIGVLHVIPACRQALDILGPDANLLVFAQPHEGAPVNPDWLRWLYDLSPTEALVAAHLTAGLTLEEIAQQRNTSRDTIRTQLKAILRKTGFSRQTDLVRSLGGLNTLSPQLLKPGGAS